MELMTAQPVAAASGSFHGTENHRNYWDSSLIYQKIMEALRRSPYSGTHTKETGQMIQGLICPACGDKKAWAYNDPSAGKIPFTINCNRLSKCGARTKTLELFPEIRSRVEIDAPATESDPDHPARHYLHLRGISQALKGLEYRYDRDVRGTGSGAVMFPLVSSNGSRPWNGRLFNPPPGAGKTHNIGSTSGSYWRHPGIEYDRGEEVFITEGILSALSLIEMGSQAIAVVAAGQDPEKLDLGDFPLKVLAFDGDTAGGKAFRKWREKFPGASMLAMPKAKDGDWNDFLLRHGPKARRKFDEKRAKHEHYARLLIAEDAEAWAKEHQDYHRKPPGLFEFGGCYYYAGKSDDSEGPRKVSDFKVDVDHYLIDESDPEKPEYKCSLKITRANGTSKTVVFSAADLSGEGTVRTAFLSAANTLWEGGKFETMALTRRIIRSGAREIRVLKDIGFDESSGCYVFGPFMIDSAGRFVKPDDGQIFRMSGKGWIRPANAPYIAPAKVGRKAAASAAYAALGRAWGDNARFAAAWVVASWFYREIMEHLRFFPFLSLHGAPQTGKSTLVRKLKAAQCLDEEGVPMIAANTMVGYTRNISSRNRLFQALLEESGDRKSRFDFRVLLPAYNGNPIKLSGKKSNDKQTVELPISCGLMFCQNIEPFQTRPEKERVLSLRFRTDDVTDETKAAFQELARMDRGRLASVFPVVMEHHNDIRCSWQHAFDDALKDLERDVQDNRICENHAVVLAFHRILTAALGVDDGGEDFRDFVAEKALEKIASCQEPEDNEAQTFLEIMLENARAGKNPDAIAIAKDKTTWQETKLMVNLKGVLNVIRDAGLICSHNDLIAKLKRHPSFVESRYSFDFLRDRRNKSAFVFRIEKISNNDG